MSRFYVPRESVKGDTIVISGEEAHHIVDVMRLKESDAIVAFDGTGREYTGTISSVRRGSVVIGVTRVTEPVACAAAKITLVQAIPKKAKMDYIVEKATELGVSAIAPVVTGRTVPDWDEEKRAAAVRRWRRIVLEASKQSSRADIPAVADIVGFTGFIKTMGRYDLALLPTLYGKVVTLGGVLNGFKGKSIVLAIGPEGDFTPAEVKQAEDAGFRPVSLGRRVLKSDTAGLAALAILDYELTR